MIGKDSSGESFPSSESPMAPSVPVVTASSDRLPLDVPPISSSLACWEKKVHEVMAQRSKVTRSSRAPVECVAQSPVSSRTRTGLKRSSSFSFEDESRASFRELDKTSISLRAAHSKRKSRVSSQAVQNVAKRGRHDNDVCEPSL